MTTHVPPTKTISIDGLDQVRTRRVEIAATAYVLVLKMNIWLVF